MLDFRSDLAYERRNIYRKANNIKEEISGVETQEEKIDNNIQVYRVKIINEDGEKALGKKRGNYITIDVKNLEIAGEEEIEKISKTLTEELKKVLTKLIKPKEDILVVGLGNLYVTPDSLGPKVIQNIDITRHILTYLPNLLDENTRSISAVSPGVLGTTGIETLEILKGIVDNIHPKLLIVIDALASRSIERIGSSVQISDTGIIPGAGVDNARKELSIKTLGIPVISIGAPTVVEAATIAADSLDLLTEKLKEQNIETKILSEIQSEDKYQIIKEILSKKEYNFVVTPKEIDDLINNMSHIIANGINFAIK